MTDHNLVMQGAGLGLESIPQPNPDRNVYTVYGESYCGYTNAACKLLEQKKKRFDYHQFRNNKQARASIAALTNDNHSTIPMVFHGKAFVGGYSQLVDEIK